jgi:hypothetical protein
MAVKRYWVRDLRNDKEYLTNATDKNHLSSKTAIPVDKMQICQVYKRLNLDPNDLVLLR